MSRTATTTTEPRSGAVTTPDLSPATLTDIALAVTEQSWERMGFASETNHDATVPTSCAATLSQRITAILAVRCIALVAEPGKYKNLSTTAICRSIQQTDYREFPPGITHEVIRQLYEFVHRMLAGYKDVPYHNREHAYHVTQSMNKLMDIMLNSGGKTFGLKFDPLALFAMIFSGLVHDVEHQGIPNRQLAIEDDRLAVLYNDQSMAENWSLYVGFSEFLQDEFKALRDILMIEQEAYRRFRRMVITMVLATDIASPERTQVGKSKWKEAFGDPFETIERKIRENRRLSIVANRRGSAISAISGIGFDDSRHNLMISEHDDDDDDDDTDSDPDEDGSYSITPENSERERDAAQFIASKLIKDLDPSQKAKFERRMSATSMQSSASRFRQRLGILRTVDLSGETIETYQRRGSIASSTHASLALSKSGNGFGESFAELADEPDELKASVVMDTLLTAADVAHNLQGWDQMEKWSGRLYLELRRAFVAGRGSNDPKERWFENQIGFLESYLLPLARRLEDTGVFGEEAGQKFSAIVEQNRDLWLVKGFDISQAVIAVGEKQYPKSK